MAAKKNCSNCGSSLRANSKTCSKCGTSIRNKLPAKKNKIIQPSRKSAGLALVLCLFFGIFGIHRFYVGKIGTALLMLITFGGLGIWFLFDLILISTNRFEDKQGKYLIFISELNPLKEAVVVLGVIAAWCVFFLASWIVLILYITSSLVYPINNQLAALRLNDITKAYSFTSKDFKKNKNLSDFKDFIDQYPELKNNAWINFNDRKMNNNIGLVQGTLTSIKGTSVNIEYKLVKEKGVWKIQSIKFIDQKME